MHDDVINWKHFPRYWPFVRGIHRWTVNSPHKGQWRGALICFLWSAPEKRLSKPSRRRWFEKPSRSLWRTRNRTRTRKLFIWQVQVQSYNKSGKKHNIIELYKYSQETEAKVQECRYHQSHLVGHAVSWVDHRKRRWVFLVSVCYVHIKVHM